MRGQDRKREARREAIAKRLVGSPQAAQGANGEVATRLIENIARLMFIGATVPEICEELSIPPEVVGKAIADPIYAETVRELRVEANALAADAATLMKRRSAEAVLHATEIMRYGSNRDRLTAAFGILDRSGHAPRQGTPEGARIEVSERVAERLLQTMAEISQGLGRAKPVVLEHDG